MKKEPCSEMRIIMNNISTLRNDKTTFFGKHGKLHVSGKHLLDSNNNIVQLRGISTHNLSSFPQYVNIETFKWFVDTFNVSVIRLAMYSDFADGDNGYSDGTDEHRSELISLILKGVDICSKLGIYCLIDWHILFDYNPLMNKDMSVDFWKRICPLLKESDNVIYEICNEPNMNLKTKETATWYDIKTYSNEIIPLIRSIDEDKIIIVGTPIWSQNVNEAADSPLDYDNIMYSLHFYADTHKEELRKKMYYALDKELPIFVTEFGPCDALGDGIINDKETNIWLDALNKELISFIDWNLSNKDETSAIIKPSCDKLENFTADDLSASGLLLKDILMY